MIMSGGDKRKVSAIIVAGLTPKKVAEENNEAYQERAKPEESEVSEGMMAASQEIIDAYESKDAKGLALALKGFFELCELEPHEEGPHEEVEENE